MPTALEQEKIQSYLAVKYGITKKSSDNAGTVGQDERDYFASDGTVIWDYSVNSSYNNDIIGIIRDDKSKLLQKQTRTIDDKTRVFISSLAATNAANTGVISNDVSSILVGHNSDLLMATAASNLEKPVGINSRIEREWKVTNTNFSDNYSIEIEWDSVGTFNINDIRLLVDTDGDFTDATIYSTADGLVFSNGSIIVSGINTTHIPLNSTRYITLGSVKSTTPLPVELIYFAANPNGGEVDIKWTTASEINNDYFTVERSRDAIDWEELRVIDGAGNSSLVLDYETVDKKPYQGVSYYRLKQTDFDGKFEYSQIIVVKMDNYFDSEINIYPNPAKNQVILEGDGFELKDLNILNSFGQNVTRHIRVIENSQKKMVLDVSNLSPGTYFIKIGAIIEKVVKE